MSIAGVIAHLAVSLVLSVRPEFGPMGDMARNRTHGELALRSCRPSVCGKLPQCAGTHYCLLTDCKTWMLSWGPGWRLSAWC